MQTIKNIEGQLLVDIAEQAYGNADAVIELLQDNPSLVTTNDPDELDLAYDLVPGQTISIRDADDDAYDAKTLKKLAGAIIATYN